MFAESLTVRILADSSSLRSELESALGLLDAFAESVASVGAGARSLASAFESLSGASAPLQQLSKLLAAIQKQILAIARTPLTINTQPALASLAGLIAMLELAAARMSLLASQSPATSKAAPGLAGRTGMALRGAAIASPAAGLSAAASALPAARDVSPFLLSQPGRRERSELHVNDSTGLRRSSAPPGEVAQTQSRSRAPADLAAPAAATVNNFGGITVNVREVADVNSLVRDLRLQGVHLRNRRG